MASGDKARGYLGQLCSPLTTLDKPTKHLAEPEMSHAAGSDTPPWRSRHKALALSSTQPPLQVPGCSIPVSGAWTFLLQPGAPLPPESRAVRCGSRTGDSFATDAGKPQGQGVLLVPGSPHAATGSPWLCSLSPQDSRLALGTLTNRSNVPGEVTTVPQAQWQGGNPTSCQAHDPALWQGSVACHPPPG